MSPFFSLPRLTDPIPFSILPSFRSPTNAGLSLPFLLKWPPCSADPCVALPTGIQRTSRSDLSVDPVPLYTTEMQINRVLRASNPNGSQKPKRD